MGTTPSSSPTATSVARPFTATGPSGFTSTYPAANRSVSAVAHTELSLGKRVRPTLRAAGPQCGADTRCRTWSHRDCSTRSAGSAWVRPSARPCNRSGRGWGRTLLNAPGGQVLDGVSVLHTQPCVKRKARDAFGGGVEGRSGDTPGVAIAAEVMGCYDPLLEPPEVVSRAAKVAKTLKSRAPAK
jgi:hypothetical protein